MLELILSSVTESLNNKVLSNGFHYIVNDDNDLVTAQVQRHPFIPP